MVFSGALGTVQIAALAGVDKKARVLEGIPPNPPALDIPKLAPAPKLEGHLEQGEWDAASSLATLIDAGNFGRSFDCPEQRVYFAYDDHHLYVAMRSHFPTGALYPRAPTRKTLVDPDVEVWAANRSNGG